MSKNYNNKQQLRPIGAKLTPEELKEKQEQEAKRAFYQKRNSLAEIILANAVQGTDKKDYNDAVDAAIAAADYFMEKAYAVSIKVKEEETK